VHCVRNNVPKILDCFGGIDIIILKNFPHDSWGLLMLPVTVGRPSHERSFIMLFKSSWNSPTLLKTLVRDQVIQECRCRFVYHRFWQKRVAVHCIELPQHPSAQLSRMACWSTIYTNLTLVLPFIDAALQLLWIGWFSCSNSRPQTSGPPAALVSGTLDATASQPGRRGRVWQLWWRLKHSQITLVATGFVMVIQKCWVQ